MAFFSPVCLGIIYLDITGHGKGFGYDLGSEKPVSVFLGIVELRIWLALLLLPNLYLFRKIRGRKLFSALVTAAYVLLFFGGVAEMGGMRAFARCFGA